MKEKLEMLRENSLLKTKLEEMSQLVELLKTKNKKPDDSQMLTGVLSKILKEEPMRPLPDTASQSSSQSKRVFNVPTSAVEKSDARTSDSKQARSMSSSSSSNNQVGPLKDGVCGPIYQPVASSMQGQGYFSVFLDGFFLNTTLLHVHALSKGSTAVLSGLMTVREPPNWLLEPWPIQQEKAWKLRKRYR